MTRRTFLGVMAGALAAPARVTVFTEEGDFPLERSGAQWAARDVLLAWEGDALVLEAPRHAVLKLRVRWPGGLPERWRYLGDQWERSYGDLEWRAVNGDRLMPWYFLASDGKAARGWGVKTGCRAMCGWQADPAGVSLWADVRCGGRGVRLGKRRLTLAEVVTASSERGQSPFEFARAFCRKLAHAAILPAAPVYGWNTWYYTYGRGLTAESVLRDAAALASLAPAKAEHRPFLMIDDGWQEVPGAGPWTRGHAGFPDLAGLAARMRQDGVRPGIWVRPLYTAEKLPAAWRLEGNRLNRRVPEDRMVLDPSVPEVLEHVRQETRHLARAGYEMIKHDYTTFDLFGRWGFEMTQDLTNAGWAFRNSAKTTAEVVLDLYRALREAAGGAMLIGCNTIGHLCAGLAEQHRIGDDNSGQEWSRTRRMGVNTLAFRNVQHGAFFAADADCAPITPQTPWAMNRQWLDLLARSGTPLFVSAHPGQLSAEQREAVRRALAEGATPRPPAEALDWMETPIPRRWRIDGKVTHYDWWAAE